jgi:hypothetical protein
MMMRSKFAFNFNLCRYIEGQIASQRELRRPAKRPDATDREISDEVELGAAKAGAYTLSHFSST